jgi:four helix bundle protein
VCVLLFAALGAKEAATALVRLVWTSLRCHASFAMGGMQTRERTPRFIALDLSIDAISILRPVVSAIRRSDRDLSEQLRRALTSVSLNLAEGNRSQGGHRVARFSTAAGSASEARAALRVAVAWGYVRAPDVEDGDRILDRVAGLLHGLGAVR